MEKKLFRYITVGLLSAVLILSLALIVRNDDFERETVQVQSTSSSTFQPDMYTVTVGYSEERDVAEGLSESVNSQIEDIKQAIYAEGVPESDLKTDSFSITPLRTTLRDSSQPRFTASQRITFEGSNLTNLNKILSASTRSGANSISNTRFFLSEQAEVTAEKELIQQAVEKARSKASTIASADNRDVGKSISLETHQSSQPFLRLESATVSNQGSASVDTGVVDYSVSVSATFQLK